MLSLRRFSLTFITAAIVTMPVMASAARPISSIVNSTAQTVSKADFLQWSMEALDVSSGDESCTLPYVRYPRGLKGDLCLAQEKGLLKVLGNTKAYTLARPITRGEALIVLTVLTGKAETADVSAFKDLKTDPEKQAVMNAVSLRWLLPERPTYFGISKMLRGSEALSILEAVTGQMPDRVQSITLTIDVPTSDSGTPHGELLEAVWQLIQRDYLRRDAIDEDEAGYAAIEGFVNSLDDPYTTFFRPANASSFEAQIKGEITGIGAHVEEKDGVIVIVAPLPGSPAERAGILAGDEILESDGTVLSGMDVDKAVTFIRGPKGTTVTLKIRRSGVEMTIKVVRDVIVIPEIDVSWQGGIAVVQLAQFGETTRKQIRSIFQDIAKVNPQGIILDLRNNGGGLLSAADVVVSNFVPKGTVVAQVKARTSTSHEVTDDEPTIPSSVRVVVLVNKGSASASEIVAGALQDLRRATIVGSTTFGKGTVQEVVSFRSGEALKLTIAEWLTPLGRTIQDTGITPDNVVESGDRNDELRRAIEVLR